MIILTLAIQLGLGRALVWGTQALITPPREMNTLRLYGYSRAWRQGHRVGFCFIIIESIPRPVYMVWRSCKEGSSVLEHAVAHFGFARFRNFCRLTAMASSQPQKR